MLKARWLLLLTALCLVCALSVSAEGTLTLPASLTQIEAAAFEGDGAVTSVVIPQGVTSIGSRAFADCAQLSTVRIESTNAAISDDAFDGSPVKIEAYAGSTAETYAYAHGLEVTLIDGGNFNDMALSLIMARGKPSSAAHGELYASERLLVQMNGNQGLPDISAYSPSRILSEGTGYFVVQFDDMAQASACHDYLKTAEGVSIVEPDRFVTAVASGEVSAASLNENWSDSDPMGMAAYSAYIQSKYPNASASVAVIDSGVAQHSALNSYVRSGYDLTGQNNPRYDATGHGTSVAGCIVDAVYGANVKIIPIRVFGVDFVTTSMIRQAIQKAISAHPTVINISYGFDESAIISSMLQHTSIPVVVSAGNDGVSCDNLFPAKLSNVYTVSALATTMTRWSDSNYGGCVNFCAPGENIAGYTSAGGTYNYYKGTSYAAPQISAAIALLAMDADRPVQNINDALKSVCVDLGSSGHDKYYGWGMPNMAMLRPKVTKIVITNEIPSVMQVGGTSVLLYEVLPEWAEDKTVTISASDPSVLNVTKTADGVLRIVGLSQGTATITIAANDGSGTTTTTGEIQVVQPVTSISLAAATHEVNLAVEGETLGISATCLPTDATNKGLIWSSSDETKAVVAQNGVVTPVAVNDVDENGDPIPVIIRADAADSYGAYATFEVYVINLIKPTAIGIVKSSSEMTVGQNLRLGLDFDPEGCVETVTWYSTDKSIASVATDGTVTAKKSGRVFIVVTSTVAPEVQASCELIITQPPIDVTLTIPSGADGYLDVGKSLQLSATVLPADADDTGIVWSSSNEAVAVVDQNGKISAISSGSTVIRAAAHGDISIYKSYALTVRQLPVEIQITGDNVADGKTHVFLDTTKQLTATVLPANTDNKSVTWSSSDTTVATVTQTGQVRGVKRGTAVITVKSVALPSLSASVTVEVYPEWTYYDWTLASEVPSNGIVTDRKWTYTELKTTDNASESGWTQTGTRWTQTGSGAVRWVDFGPISGFDHSNSLYTTFNQTAPQAYENTTNKRTVSTVNDGYIFWHWMYDCGGGSNGDRAIFYKKGTGTNTLTGNNYGYKYFGAHEDTQSGTQMSAGSNWGQDDTYYLWYTISGYNTNATNQGSKYWYRTQIHKSTYVEYKKQYDYKRDVTVTTEPVASATVTNIKAYVKYKVANSSSVQISNWVSESSVPSGAEVVDSKWTYKETITNNSATMSGWTQESSTWQQAATGAVRWVDFSPISGFDHSNSLYAAYNKTAPTAYENTTAKRVINGTTNDGYIFWHWMYDCGGGNNGDRAIFYMKGTGSSTLTGNNYGYKYFGAFEDTQNGTQMGANTNWGQNDTYYLWYTVSGHGSSYSQNQGSKYWYRTQIKKTSYTDYTKLFTYSRTVTTTTQPTAGGGISNITKLVRYIIK